MNLFLLYYWSCKNINILRPSSTIYFFTRFSFQKFQEQSLIFWDVIGKNLKAVNLYLIFNQIKWEQILYNENSDVNFSMNEYLSKIGSLLDAPAPIKKPNKKELKFVTKPWMTLGLQNSIKKKNKIYSKFVKCKNKLLKEIHHNSYKNYRNLLSTLLKRAKKVLHKLL